MGLPRTIALLKELNKLDDEFAAWLARIGKHTSIALAAVLSAVLLANLSLLFISPGGWVGALIQIGPAIAVVLGIISNGATYYGWFRIARLRDKYGLKDLVKDKALDLPSNLQGLPRMIMQLSGQIRQIYRTMGLMGAAGALGLLAAMTLAGFTYGPNSLHGLGFSVGSGLGASGKPGAPPAATAQPTDAAATATVQATVAATVPTGPSASPVASAQSTVTPAQPTVTPTIGPTSTPVPVITNGGFDSGTLADWTLSGPNDATISSPGRTDTYAAKVGGSSSANGNSYIMQSFIAPSGAKTLSFWYRVVCPSGSTGWGSADLTDTSSGTTSTMQFRTCSTASWSPVTLTLAGGHSYTLTLYDHVANSGTNPTYILFDDVVVS